VAYIPILQPWEHINIYYEYIIELKRVRHIKLFVFHRMALELRKYTFEGRSDGNWEALPKYSSKTHSETVGTCI
jgi:hypothetical protein